MVEIATPTVAPETKNSTSNITEEHIGLFSRRAGFHAVYSYVVSGLIFLLFGGTIAFMFFAGKLNQYETSVELYQALLEAKSGQEVVLRSEILSLEGVRTETEVGLRNTSDVVQRMLAVGQARSSLLLLQAKCDLARRGYAVEVDGARSREELNALLQGADANLAELQAYRTTITRRFEVGEITRTDVMIIDAAVAGVITQKRVLAARIRTTPPASEVQDRYHDVDLTRLITTNVVRFGGAVTSIFLISLLIPIYRYNVRLSNFYKARADSMRLCRDLQLTTFVQLADALTPSYGFDQEPKTPIDAVASMLGSGLSAARRG